MRERRGSDGITSLKLGANQEVSEDLAPSLQHILAAKSPLKSKDRK